MKLPRREESSSKSTVPSPEGEKGKGRRGEEGREGWGEGVGEKKERKGNK
jgi:hypothetical protein